MTRMFHPPELERSRERDRFDPIHEGERHGLSRELSLAIWKRVSSDATDTFGRRNEERARERFHELAARIAARGGRRRPDPGRLTRVGVEISGEAMGTWAADELMPRVPGRQTLAAVEAQRWAKRAGETAMAGEPARVAARNAEQQAEVDEQAENERREPPCAGEVARAMAALQVGSREAADMQPVPVKLGSSAKVGDWLTTHRLSTGDVAKPATPERQGPLGKATSSGLVLEPYLAPALKDVLQRIGPNHRLRREFIAATANPVRSIAGTARWAAPLPSTPMTNGHVLWQVAERHAATLYRRAVSSGAVDPHEPAVEAVLQKRGTGQPLPAEIRHEMERELGISLVGVRIHTDAVAAQAARALAAEAFTLGEDIFFSEGTFAPETTSGRKLLAHELTHVAQALRGDTGPVRDGLRVSQPGERHEQEADTIAARISQAAPPSPPGFGPFVAHEREETKLGAVRFQSRIGVPRPLRDTDEAKWGGSSVHVDLEEIAEQGLLGASEPLPYLDAIQRAFGKYDVTRVKTKTGSSARYAAEKLDANAYAFDGKVGFADAPSLHEVAHEAAHVTQQRRGVAVDGSLDSGSGDSHEQHADAVADAVVAGRCAEPLLDSMRGATPTIQRDTKKIGTKKDDKKHVAPAADIALLGDRNYRLLGTSGYMVIRTAWIMKGATTNGNRISNPDRMKELYTELRKVFWWISDAQVEASKTNVIDAPQLPLSEPCFRFHPKTSCFTRFGLPPGTDIEWKREADGGASLILSIRNAGIEQPPVTGESVFLIDDELRKQIHAKFVAKFAFMPATYPVFTRPTLEIAPKTWAWVIPFKKDEIAAIAGPGWAKVKETANTDPSQEETSVFRGITFPNYIPIADREYYVKWVEDAFGKQALNGPTGAVDIDDDLIRMMQQLDKNKLLKEKVIERMLRVRMSDPGFALDSRSFRRLVHETQEVQELYTWLHQVQVAPRKRYYERPITGEIFNLGSLASVDKSMDFYFKTDDPPGLGFVGVTILWLATPKGDPKTHTREGKTFNYAHQEPAKWSVSFDKVGAYEITAIVDHQSYWPTTFKTSVDVQTEESRLSQVEQHAFGGFAANTKVKETEHFFDVSFTNDRFGPNKYTFGTVKEGELLQDYAPQTLDARLAFMKKDRDALSQLIEAYGKRTDRPGKDIVAYATAARDRLDESDKDIRDDAKDLVPFEIRGAFLSDKNGVRSGDLNLVGLAGQRHKSRQKRWGKDEFITEEWDQPTVRIHDMSQLYEPRNAVYTGEGDDFRQSAEKAFIDLCKSYPPGRITVVMEQVTRIGARTGKTLGFELHTGTAWKDVKEVVWDSKVQIVVNLVGAAAAIFLPGVGAVIAMGLITAYNATDTVDNLAGLERKGQATRGDYASAFVRIGLDLVPFASEIKAVGKLGKTTLFALDAAQISTNVIVMTAEGLQQIKLLRDQQVKHVAQLQQEIEDLRNRNDSSLELKAKERELNEAIIEAQNTAGSVFKDMAGQGAIMLMMGPLFNHMLKGYHGGSASLAKSEMFVEGAKGEVPHYNPETGKIHGDSKLLTPELTASLNEMWTMDVYAKHADAANVLGVSPHEVMNKRSKDAKATTVKKNADGSWEITTPEGRPHQSMLDDVWRERQKLADAPRERPKALERGSYEPTFSADEILKTSKPVLVGNRIEGRGDAEAVLKKLAAGDRSALKNLGLEKLPKGFDPRSVEWGLGVLPDGKYVIVRGDAGVVDWTPFPEVRALAHSHPYRASKVLKADGGEVGIHILDMVKGGGVNEQNKVSFFPSAADIEFCVRNALQTHSIATPYVHIGKGVIGNPVGAFEGKPRVIIEIRGASHAGSFDGGAIPANKAHIVVHDESGTLIWEGEMSAVHQPNAGSLIGFGDVPWIKPGGRAPSGIGGETGAPIRKPKTKSEQIAYDDWKKLEKSQRNYSGKFDAEERYTRYEEGLRYDADSQRWIRPDGTKARDPQKFDSKRWTKSNVYDHLAGPDSKSTFKPFAEMLIREKIATRAQIEKMIEKKGFLGRDEDVVRHELKLEYRDAILDKMREPETPEDRHQAMRRITEQLNSADKGNITEAWCKEQALGGSGQTHVAARQDVLKEDQGIEISKDRFLDIVDGNIGHEIKSGEGRLSDVEIEQMEDLAKMVDGKAVLRTENGDVTIEHGRYTFTSPGGAKANAEVIRRGLTDSDTAGRIAFQVYTPEGKLVKIESVQQLDAQTWMFR